MSSPEPRPSEDVLVEVVQRGTRSIERRRRRRRLLAGTAVVAALALGGAAVARSVHDDTGRDQVLAGPTPSTGPGGTAGDGPGFDLRSPVDPASTPEPPTVRIGDADHLLDLRPWTTCWTTFCADGMPPTPLERIDGTDELFVEFPVEGWQFEATTTVADDPCGRMQTEDLVAVGPTLFRLPAQGPPGDYQVDVFGRGPGGDVIVSFAWRTTTTGALPEPTASLSLLADHDGAVDSYGVEFRLSDLDRTPDDVAATVTVTAANGAHHTITLRPVASAPCNAGQVSLSAPLEEGLLAAGLGDPPFTYDVTVTLDGRTHRASASWPADEDEECAPCVPLRFDPPLPSLADGAGGPEVPASDGDEPTTPSR